MLMKLFVRKQLLDKNIDLIDRENDGVRMRMDKKEM